LRPDVPLRVPSVSPVAVNMRRVASAMFTIDRAENGRLYRDVVHRENDAAGALMALIAWVFHSCLRCRGRRRGGGFGAADPLAVLLAAVSAATGGYIRRVLQRSGTRMLCRGTRRDHRPACGLGNRPVIPPALPFERRSDQ
jgi:hypothetical protein